VKTEGLYIAFVAGTGVLPFVDLVGRLAMANLELDTAVCDDERDLINLDKFKLVFYCSFRKRSDAVALDLLYELSDYCMANQPAH
jgi:hypothetical protein